VQEGSDLIVVTEERNEKLGAAALKDESEVAVAAAFEELVSKLADTNTAVRMGLTENINQIAKSKETFYPFVFWQFTKALDDGGIYGKEFTQASS
jgi:hypothetical protein